MNNTPQNNIPSQSPTQGHEYYAKPGGPPGLIYEPSGSGQPQGVNNLIHVHPPVQAKLTECFKIHSQGATPAHDRTGDHEDTQHPGGIPRNHGEIHFNRNKEKGLDTFDGKAQEFKPWRRRMAIYVSEEDAAYATLMEWARTQKDVITEAREELKTSGFGDTEARLGIDVKEFSRKLYNFLCKWLGHSRKDALTEPRSGA